MSDIGHALLVLGLLSDVVVVDHGNAVGWPYRLRDFERVAILVGRVVDQVDYRAPGRYLKQAGFLGRCPADLPAVARVGIAPLAEFLDAQNSALGTTVGCSRYVPPAMLAGM
jgi:hypothetical protein